MYVRRTNNVCSGWGVELRWTRSDRLANWWYDLCIVGIQHPGAWSRFTLRVGRDRGYYHEWTVRTREFSDVLHRVWQGLHYDIDPAIIYPQLSPPVTGMIPFWKLAQGARRTRDAGAACALVDWLCEKDVPLPGGCGLTELLMEGVPGVRKVLAARESEKLGDAGADAVRDKRVAAV